MLGAELLGGKHPEALMRSDLVELLAAISDHHLAFPQGVEHFPSEAFLVELVVKVLMLPSGRTPLEHVAFGSGPSRSARFHLTILPGTARVDGEGLDPCLLQQVPQEVGDELTRSARPSAGYLAPLGSFFRAFRRLAPAPSIFPVEAAMRTKCTNRSKRDMTPDNETSI